LTEKDPIKARLDWLLSELKRSESEDSWREFMKGLKRRGLKRVWMVISDAHRGIQAEVKKEWLGTVCRDARSIEPYLILVTIYLIE